MRLQSSARISFSHFRNCQYKNLAPRKKDRRSRAAAARTGRKINNLAKLMKIVASPGRSLLRLLTTDEVLVHFDRVLMRIFEKDPHYSMVINIYAFNFESMRHLRILNNLSVSVFSCFELLEMYLFSLPRTLLLCKSYFIGIPSSHVIFNIFLALHQMSDRGKTLGDCARCPRRRGDPRNGRNSRANKVLCCSVCEAIFTGRVSFPYPTKWRLYC